MQGKGDSGRETERCWLFTPGQPLFICSSHLFRGIQIFPFRLYHYGNSALFTEQGERERKSAKEKDRERALN